MPKPNYGFQKRQKELTKQQKRAEKLERRLARKDLPAGGVSDPLTELTDQPNPLRSTVARQDTPPSPEHQ